MAKGMIASVFLFLWMLRGDYQFAFAAATQFPSFIAVCDDKEGHGFRSGTDLQGKMLPDKWSNDETFPSDQWETFKYTKGQDFLTLETQSKRAPIVASHDHGMVIMNVSVNAFAVSVWTFAINLKIRRIVASQVNSYGTLGTGIKGRVVQLECSFRF